MFLEQHVLPALRSAYNIWTLVTIVILLPPLALLAFYFYNAPSTFKVIYQEPKH